MVDVLDGDSAGLEGGTLTLVSVASASGGTARVMGQQVRFTAGTRAVAAGGFTYTARNSLGVSASARVTVRVLAATLTRG
jgi:hypothetical protein